VSTLAVKFKVWYDHKLMYLNSSKKYLPQLLAENEHIHSMSQASVFLTDHKRRIQGVNWLCQKQLSKAQSKNTQLKDWKQGTLENE